MFTDQAEMAAPIIRVRGPSVHSRLVVVRDTSFSPDRLAFGHPYEGENHECVLAHHKFSAASNNPTKGRLLLGAGSPLAPLLFFGVSG